MRNQSTWVRSVIKNQHNTIGSMYGVTLGCKAIRKYSGPETKFFCVIRLYMFLWILNNVVFSHCLWMDQVLFLANAKIRTCQLQMWFCQWHFSNLKDAALLNNVVNNFIEIVLCRILEIIVQCSIREHLKGKYHCTADILFDRFRNVHSAGWTELCTSQTHISKPVKQEAGCTIILPL